MPLTLGYLLLGLFVTLLLFIGGSVTIARTYENASVKYILLTGGLILWHLYIFWLSKTGLLADFSFPPKFFLLMILPAFIFTGFFLYQQRNFSWIMNIPSHWIIYTQTYRVGIEILFIYSVAARILPPQVTIEGFNFDMVFASSAPVIAFIAFNKGMISIKWIKVWNYLGLTIIASIIFTFLTSIYFPDIYASRQTVSTDFTEYPYVLVPGFLMPAAVFLHVLSIVQLRKVKNQSL